MKHDLFELTNYFPFHHIYYNPKYTDPEFEQYQGEECFPRLYRLREIAFDLFVMRNRLAENKNNKHEAENVTEFGK